MNENPNGEGREELLGPEPRAEIVERLLEYQRRLRDEAGTEGRAGVESTETPTSVPDPDRAEAPPDASAEDDRVIRERIAPLDETLARLSAMLPLLRRDRSAETDGRT